MLKQLIGRFRAGPAAPAGKEGARAYAVGDVHGCLAELDSLLVQIDREIAASPDCPTYLVFLGDLIDRGPDSAGVIERVLSYDRPGVRTICLLGNHEEFLLRALDGETGVLHDWLEFGGRECIESYGVPGSRLAGMPEDRAIEALRRIIPDRHRHFIAGFADSFRFGDFLFVHAGIRPGVALSRQRPHDLRWIREPFLSDRADHGAVIVHGHTVSLATESLTNRIGIDTGAYRTGVLTAVCIRGILVHYLQTSVRADVSAPACRVTRADGARQNTGGALHSAGFCP